MGDEQAVKEATGVPRPHRILVPHGDAPVEADMVESVNDLGPFNGPEAGDAVAVPAGVPRVRAVNGKAEYPGLVPGGRIDLDVLRLHVDDPLWPHADGRDRIDAEPDEMRRVVVQVEAEVIHPVPELGRVAEVAGVPVGMPSLHGAVLHHEADAPFGGGVE